MTLVRVAGLCPACGGGDLRLAAGGHVWCMADGCPDEWRLQRAMIRGDYSTLAAPQEVLDL